MKAFDYFPYPYFFENTEVHTIMIVSVHKLSAITTVFVVEHTS